MLKPRLKKCGGCGFDKVIWKDGKCANCCKPSFKGFSNDKRSFDSKVASGMVQKYLLKKTRKKKPGNKEFFESQAAAYQENPVSFESGKSLGIIGNVNLAHIFPKETYKSIAHEPLNIILLSWEEHTRFDELLGRHDFGKLQMEFKSWEKICRRVEVLLPLCKEQGKLKLALIKYLS